MIERRRRQLLVHSFIYYQLDKALISDHTFDLWSKELVELQEKYPELSKECVFYDAFKDFDGSGGSSLPFADPDVQTVGYMLLNYHSNKPNH